MRTYNGVATGLGLGLRLATFASEVVASRVLLAARSSTSEALRTQDQVVELTGKGTYDSSLDCLAYPVLFLTLPSSYSIFFDTYYLFTNILFFYLRKHIFVLRFTFFFDQLPFASITTLIVFSNKTFVLVVG